NRSVPAIKRRYAIPVEAQLRKQSRNQRKQPHTARDYSASDLAACEMKALVWAGTVLPHVARFRAELFDIQKGTQSMDRRKFFRQAGTAGVGAIAATTLAAPAIAQENPKITWRMTSSFTKGLDILFGAGEIVAEHVKEASGGNFTIQHFAGGEIVPALQAADAVQAGTVEMAHTCAYYYVGKDPTFALGTSIPFGLNARQTNAWFNQAGGNELLNEFLADYNILSILLGNTGAQMGGWFRKEINTIDDLKGLKMRIAGLTGQVMQKVGVTPQQIAGGDVY